MEKKRILFPISLKLILMISLILTFSLTGLTFVATFFFQEDSIRRIQEVTSDKSQVIALKVKTDINSIIERANILTVSAGQEIAVSSAPKKGKKGKKKKKNITPAAEEVAPEFEGERDIIYLSVAEMKGGKISPLKEMKNSQLIRELPNPQPDFQAIINKQSGFLNGSFSGLTEIHNASDAFGSPVLCLSMPGRRSGETDLSRIVVVYFSMNMFFDAVQSYSEYVTFIVNGKGELVAHPDSSLMLGNVDFSGNAIVQAMLKSPVNNGQTTYADEKNTVYLGSFRKVELAGAGVVTAVSRDVALEAVYNLRRRNIYITVIVLMFAVITVYIFAKTLTEPVKRLVAASGQIKEGNFRLSLKSSTRDEIGVLTDSFLEMGKGLEEREKMKEAFGKFVNREIADLAMKGELKLGGERKTAAIFFSDIRSFTAISEKLEPEEVVDFLNEYMSAMVDCVNRTFGVVDKFIGDAVMAVWGTPVSHGNDTENAINGALMMRKALILFNKNRGSAKKPVIKIGCGINTGPVLAGQIGSHDRMEYTVIGDAVNLASRIESLNKLFSTDILISEDSYKLVKGIFTVEPMRKIKVKGKAEPQQIYAVIGRRGNPEDPKTLGELRRLLGLAEIDLSKVDPEGKEDKYEITG